MNMALQLQHTRPTQTGAWPARLLLLLLLTLVTTGSAAAQWNVVNTAGLQTSLYGSYFLDRNTGWVVGWESNGSVIGKTTDGGATWSYQSVGGALLFSVQFLDPNVGLAVGYWSGCSCALLLRTTDGGATWADGTYAGSFGFYQLAFTDKTTGYVGGYNGAILKTTDAGLNWTPLTTGTQDVFREVRFADANVGYAVAGVGSDFSNPSQLYKTTNAGETWNKIQDFSGSRSLADLYFVSPQVGFIAGYDAGEAIFKTTDGGTTWTRTYSGTPNGVLQSIQFAGPNVGFAIGTEGTILSTSDGGTTWTKESSGTDSTLIALSISDGTAYVVGFGGTVLKRSGVSAAPDESSTRDVRFGIAPNPMRESATIRLPETTGSGSPQLDLYDILGNAVRHVSLQPDMTGTARIQRDGLPTGTYLYTITSNGEKIGSGIITME